MDFDRSDYSAENCSVQRTLAIVGENWTLLVLREAFMGVRRFDDFQQLIGCARNILSARLATLTDHGILERRPYQEPGSRRRVEYRLTEKGRELVPAVVALMHWGDRWTADPDGPAVEVRHRGCEAPVRVTLRCDAGHDGLDPREIHHVPGPGARRRVAA